MAAGSIVIDLLMRTASFETDTRRAQARLAAFEKEVKATFSQIATGVGAVAASIGAVVAITARLADSIGVYQDLAEQIGDTASSVASLQTSADQSGTSMEEIASASVKLTQNLSKVDEESDSAARALKALGLSFNDFKKLSPTEQLRTVAEQMSKFGDGTGKTAAAVALFGKSGAQLIPFLKNLADSQEENIRLTDAQIKAADAFSEDLAKLQSQLQTGIKVAFSDLIPVVSEFVRSFGDAGSAFSIFQVGADAVRVVFETLTIVGAYVIDTFKGVGREIGALEARLQALAKFDLKGFRAISDALKEDNARAKVELDKFVSNILNARQNAQLSALGQDPRELARRGRGPAAQVAFSAPEKAASGRAAKLSELDQELKRQREQLALMGQITELEKVNAEIALGKFGKLKPAQEEELRRGADLLDQKRIGIEVEREIAAEAAALESARRGTLDSLEEEAALVGMTTKEVTLLKLAMQGATDEEIRRAGVLIDLTDAERANLEAKERGKRIYEETRTPAERLNIELAELNKLLADGHIKWDEYSRAVFAAQDKFEAASKKNEEVVDSFGKKFAENTQDFLGQGLYDAINGNFKNIGDAFAQMITRMVAEAAAADIARALFGDMVKGGSGGGFLGGLLSSASSLFGGAFAGGGDPPVGRLSLVGENGPELFVPRTAGTILPAAQTGALMRGGDTNHFSISVSSNGYMDRAAEERASARIARGVSERQRRRSA
jgi:hypothetical protein